VTADLANNIEHITLGALSATQAANVAKDLIVKSGFFRIESTGAVKSSKFEKKIVCVVTKDNDKNNKFKVLYYREE
jgi:hypothetical protein